MIRAALATFATAIICSQLGCFSVGSAVCYHSPQHPNCYRAFTPIETRVENIEFHGRLISAQTITKLFLPIITATITDGQPYHLQIWMKGERDAIENVEIESVRVVAEDGGDLFHTDEPAEFSQNDDYHEREKRRPVFSHNPAFKRWSVRKSDREGWPHSRSFEVPSNAQLVLHIEFLTDQDEPASEARIDLRRFRHTVISRLRKDIFRVTGDVPNRQEPISHCADCGFRYE